MGKKKDDKKLDKSIRELFGVMLENEVIVRKKAKEKQELLSELKRMILAWGPSEIDGWIEYINREFLNEYGLSMSRIADVEEIMEKVMQQ